MLHFWKLGGKPDGNLGGVDNYPQETEKTTENDNLKNQLSTGKLSVSQDDFNREFTRIAKYIRDRFFSITEKVLLKVYLESADGAWERMDYPKYKEMTDRILSLPGSLRLEGGKPFAAKIQSKVLGEDVWVINSKDALIFIPEGVVCYTPDEIIGLRGLRRQIYRLSTGSKNSWAEP